MPEMNERIAVLETTSNSHAQFMKQSLENDNQVMRELVGIGFKLEQSLKYQMTCDAERTAQGIRIGNLEDARKAEIAARRMVKVWAAFIGAATGVCASLATVWAVLMKHP